MFTIEIPFGAEWMAVETAANHQTAKAVAKRYAKAGMAGPARYRDNGTGRTYSVQAD